MQKCIGEKKLAQTFVNYLKKISEESLVLLIGFDISIGHKSGAAKVLQLAFGYDRNRDNEFKYANTHKAKQSAVLKQTPHLPNVFFVDALFLLHETLDNSEKRVIQAPTINHYYQGIVKKINPFALGPFRCEFELESIRDMSIKSYS